MNRKKNGLRKWLGLAAIIPAVAMVFIDQAVLPVALPTIQEQLGASRSQLWWCINAYLLVSAVFMLPGGKLGDRFGQKKVFMLGILVFALSSALCAVSQGIIGLISARAIQGVGAAMMVPSTAPLIMALFPPYERGRAMGINVSVSSLFLVLAPLIGGYFTQELSWRGIFWLNLPLAALGLIFVYRLIPKPKKKQQNIDYMGFAFFTLFLSALVTLIMEGKEWGWLSWESLILVGIFILSSVLMVQREKRSKYPFVDISLFKHPVFKAVNISVFSTQFVLMITIYRAFFFQSTMDWSPVQTGVVFSLTSTPVLFMSLIGGWLSDKFQPRLPITLGFSLLIFSFFWTAFFVEYSLDVLLIGFMAFGFGVPLVLTPSYSSAMSAIPPQKSGAAFGVIATIRVTSSTLAVAILSGFAKQVSWVYFVRNVKGNSTLSGMDLKTLKDVSMGLDSTQGAIFDKNEALLSSVLKLSEIFGFKVVHLTMGCLLILAFTLVFILYSRKSAHEIPQSPAEGWD